MTGAERAIRWSTAVVVLAVASIAAVVSYSHIYALGRAHGQGGAAARLLPLSVDGLILASGLVLLHAARRQDQAPSLARWMLWLGITATVGANVSYGLPYGPLGAVVSAWPAVAFIGSAEMALGMVRSARTNSRESAESSSPLTTVAADAQSAARLALGASIAASNPISQRQMIARFGITRGAERTLRSSVLAEMNGHAPEGACSEH